jgi:nitrogen fixation NifU-like protein
MSDLDELYQEVILDHNRSPRNYGPLDHARQAEGYNPLCGDRIDVYVKLDGDVIREVHFAGKGCAISQASASVMTESLKGKTVGEAKALFERFQRMVTGEGDDSDLMELGEMAAMAGVSQFPSRVKCATLCWHTLEAALAKKTDEPVSTE